MEDTDLNCSDTFLMKQQEPEVSWGFKRQEELYSSVS